MHRDRVLPLDAEGDLSRGYTDGDLIVRGDGAVRVHVPRGVGATLEAAVDLARPGVFVDVDLDGKVATFSNGGGRVRARGECVRVLEVYLAARRADVPAGGWLSAADAHAAWVALGGSPGAPLDRISWERCRLRSVLSRDGAVGVGSLFEVAPGRDARVRVSGTYGS